MVEYFSFSGERLADDVRERFGDEAGAQITDEMLLRWINDGQRQIATEHPFLRKVAKTTLIEERANYDLDVLFSGHRMQRFESIEVAGRRMQFVPWTQLQDVLSAVGANQVSGAPELVSEYGGTIRLYPTPKERVANGIVIYYVAFPEDIAELTDELSVPDRFFTSLTDYVYARALELDENWDAAKMMRGSYEEQMRLQRGHEESSPQEYYPTMTMLDRDEADAPEWPL